MGFLWTGCYGLLFRTPAHALATGETAEYTLTVSDFPTETRRGCAFPAKLCREGAADPVVQVYADAEAMGLCPGDTIQVSLRLVRSDFLQGESFDYFQSKGIYLLGYAGDTPVLLERPASPPPLYWPQYAAKTLKESLLCSFPKDVSGLAVSLVTGDKSALPTGAYAALQRAGLAHMVAVSGLHISFLALLLAMILGKRSKLSIAVTLPMIFFFAVLTGSAPSALRAALMTTVLLLAPLVNREEDKPTTLSAVLIFLLILCPYAAVSISLQLSFAAVAGIFLITGPLYSRWLKMIPKWKSLPGRALRRLLIFCAGSISTSFGALLFTTPLCAYYFHSVSLAGPLANLLTLWVVSILFSLALLIGTLGLFLPGPAVFLGHLTAWGFRWVLFVARSISRMPYAAVPLRTNYLTVWFVLSYLVLLLWLWKRRDIHPVFPVSALLICLCAALVSNAWPILTGTFSVTALDIGQGSSTLICSQGHAVLVDCGGSGAADPGDVAADFVQSYGSSKLDALILTHCHSDHVNGVEELFTRLDISRLILPKVDLEDSQGQAVLSIANAYGCKAEQLDSDITTTFGSAEFQIYAPLGDGGVNESGLSILCTSGDFDVLITGDMNDIVERRLVKYKSLPDIELLVVGHHGAKTSTSEELLLATTPEMAVISCGYNTYGHPAPETLERLGAAGCDIYCTYWTGHATFTISEKERASA